jgi:hypothetical protein
MAAAAATARDVAASEHRMGGRASPATIVAVAAPVIDATVIAPATVVIPTTIIVVTSAADQTVMVAFSATNLAALVARQPVIGAENAPLGAKLALAFAKGARLLACDLSGAYAATYAMAVKAVVHAAAAVVIALRKSFIREAQHQDYGTQQKNLFHRSNPFPKIRFSVITAFVVSGCAHTAGESSKMVIPSPESRNYDATIENPARREPKQPLSPAI